MTVGDAKAALRAHLRGVRSRSAPAALIMVPAAFADGLAPGMVVAAYIAVRGEADPSPLVACAERAGCRLALPRVVDRATPLRFVEWQGGDVLAAGPFGLRQPSAAAGDLIPDLILTPLVGFDAVGNRIGQGAGHYDRAFAAHPHASRIGVAWSFQRVDRIEPDPWDVALHAIVTEREWIVP